jgi:transcriptional regulator with XRE-family HTH domain
LGELERLWDLVVHEGTSVVFIQVKSHGPLTAAGLQALAHWTAKFQAEPYIGVPGAVRRMALARKAGAEEELIASASIEHDKLVVWSCEPKRYEVPVSDIPALAKLGETALSTFELSASGSRIHWPNGDIDINLDTIREYADPRLRKQHELERRKEAARYGDAVRRLREDNGLKQSDIHGLSERQVRRLESGDTIPHTATLKKLATAHEMPVADYLKELAKRGRATKPTRKAQPPREPTSRAAKRTRRQP